MPHILDDRENRPHRSQLAKRRRASAAAGQLGNQGTSGSISVLDASQVYASGPYQPLYASTATAIHITLGTTAAGKTLSYGIYAAASNSLLVVLTPHLLIILLLLQIPPLVVL